MQILKECAGKALAKFSTPQQLQMLFMALEYVNLVYLTSKMIKLTFCLTRLPHLSRAEFQDYWRNHHAPLVKSFQEVLKIKRYVQAHALDDALSVSLRGPRGAPAGFDGIAELWWEREEDMASADPAARAAGKALLEDEKKFIDLAKSPIWISEEHEIINRL